MMVEINSFMVRIVFRWQNTIGNDTGDPIASGSHHIRNGRPLSILVPGTFNLVGSDGTAP